MIAPRLLRAALAAVLLPVLGCSSTTADPVRHRAVRPVANAEWARGAVFYEIFVRSFYDSNGDGIGDFNGLTSKLDYVNDLGANAIWLMPIFESPSYHGYDTTDYEAIERDYGTDADFQRFLGEAHKRGIRVIVDFVMNHTSSEHPWFLDSASSTASPKCNWYVWNSTNPGWTQPWGGNFPTWYLKNGAYYYAVFWSGMPDLNYRTPEVKTEMFRLGRLWLSQGVDGFRLDASRYLVETGPGAGQADTAETHQILKDFVVDVQRTKADAFLVAENTVDTQKLATYFDDGLSNFNFPLASAILEGVNSGNANRIRSTLRDMIAAYPSGVIDAPFLTNHDHIRIATQLGSDAGKLRNAAAILLTLPGAPFIYYGEEVGLQNGPGSEDEWKRTPMPWTPSGGFSTATPWRAYAPGLAMSNVAAETSDPQSLLSYYRNWIAARKRSKALLKGDITPIDSSAQILAFIRDSGDERVLVAHNLGNASVMFPMNATLEAIIEDNGASIAGMNISLPAHSSGAWRMR
ncbi:MAG: alpha-amylase [Acidobacteria bacterium]|nr:MAG: alpha-amylase [Acidobacteriota bacterium]